MMAISARPLTLEQFLQLPEEEPALEYFNGVVTRKMSPSGPHGTLQFEMAMQVNEHVRPRRLARVFTETRLTFDGVSVVPDLVVYLWERVPANDRGDIPTVFRDPPDIAVEIVSPGQSVGSLADRCRWYVERGVTVAVLVHAQRRWVRVFRAGMELGPFQSPERIDLGDVLPEFQLDLARLFDWLRARPD